MGPIMTGLGCTMQLMQYMRMEDAQGRTALDHAIAAAAAAAGSQQEQCVLVDVLLSLGLDQCAFGQDGLTRLGALVKAGTGCGIVSCLVSAAERCVPSILIQAMHSIL